MEENRKKIVKTSIDYRTWILFKYIYIGAADIGFWWTVWGIADHLWPMDITKDGYLSYIRGYLLIISANLLYMSQRFIFRHTCRKFYETRQKFLYPSSIVTEEEVIQNKPFRFYVLRKNLSLMIWVLVVGFIQIWRGLFASFDYIVDLLFIHYSINRALSSVVFQLFVGVTLAFTQRNNAVNLCPTHKIYKYDELEEMDGLFSLHIFKNFLKHDEELEIDCNNVEQALSPRDNQHVSVQKPKKKSFKPLKPDFDLPQYAAKKITKNIHKSSSKKDSSSVLDEPVFYVNGVQPSLTVNLSSPNDYRGIAPSVALNLTDKNDNLANDIHVNEGYNKDEIKEMRMSYSTLNNVSRERSSTDSNISEQTVTIMQHLRRASYLSLRPPKTIRDGSKAEERQNHPFDLDHCKMCRFINILAYLYTIHHRQVFLHIFGGMFWSTTWKLFDYATESVFTKTASDVPGLVLIAICSHCLNHLVLFRFKETASAIYWKTFWEFFCGLFTVTLWAPTWYIFDIIADSTGHRFYFQIACHLLVYCSLTISNVTMNLAL